MSTDLMAIEQSAQVSAELANDYMIGGLSQVAGIEGGAQLQEDVIGLMSQLGVQISPVESESGFAALGVTAIRAALTKTATRGAAALAKNPKGWAAALGIAAGGVAVSAGAYQWMTADQQIELEKIRASAALQAQALEGLSPQQKMQVANGLASQTFAPPPMNLMPWIIGGAALAGVWWFYFKKK